MTENIKVEATPEADQAPKARKNIRLAGRPFLLVQLATRPAVTRANDVQTVTEIAEDGTETTTTHRLQRTPTHRKGWANKKGEQIVVEKIDIVDRVKDRHLSTANVIIDILRGELVKSNATAENINDDMVVEHYLSKYMEECKKGIDAYLSRMAQMHISGARLNDIKAQIAQAEATA